MSKNGILNGGAASFWNAAWGETQSVGLASIAAWPRCVLPNGGVGAIRLPVSFEWEALGRFDGLIHAEWGALGRFDGQLHLDGGRWDDSMV